MKTPSKSGMKNERDLIEEVGKKAGKDFRLSQQSKRLIVAETARHRRACLKAWLVGAEIDRQKHRQQRPRSERNE